MSVSLNPYLFFGGDAREGMGFYRSVFGGELSVMTYGDMGAEGEQAPLVMHSFLAGEHGVALMGSDGAPEDLPPAGAVRIALSGDDSDLLNGWFAALAEGGAVHVPLERQMWGDVFGQVQDRYGVVWLVNISDGAQV